MDMQRKTTLLLIVSAGVVAFLLWHSRENELLRPVDAVASNELDAIPRLQRLLMQSPRQPKFIIRVASSYEGHKGWAYLEYYRDRHTLIYTPYRDMRRGLIANFQFPFLRVRRTFNTGCPDQYVCQRANEARILKSEKFASVRAVLAASGCDSGCLIITG